MKNKAGVGLYVGPVVYFITQHGTNTKLIQVYTEISITKNIFLFVCFIIMLKNLYFSYHIYIERVIYF